MEAASRCSSTIMRLVEDEKMCRLPCGIVRVPGGQLCAADDAAAQGHDEGTATCGSGDHAPAT
jgi:hypothetical protein